MFPPDVTAPLRQRVQVEIVAVAAVRHILENYHYLHRCRTGRQLNYAVLIDGVVDGVITYAYPAGITSFPELHPGEVVEFARLFLASNVPHTATCAIGKTLHRLRRDWQRLWPDAPKLKLVVSYSDKVYHKGVIYKAANFQWLKESPGAAAGGLARGHKRWGERQKYDDLGHMKDCWVYRLDNRRTP